MDWIIHLELFVAEHLGEEIPVLQIQLPVLWEFTGSDAEVYQMSDWSVGTGKLVSDQLGIYVVF